MKRIQLPMEQVRVYDVEVTSGQRVEEAYHRHSGPVFVLGYVRNADEIFDGGYCRLRLRDGTNIEGTYDMLVTVDR